MIRGEPAEAPVALPKGPRIEVRLAYDNSADNPHNPSPSSPKRVMWGEQSFDEMGSVILAMQAVNRDDEPVLQKFLGDRVRAAIGRSMENGTLKRYLDQRGGRAGNAGRSTALRPLLDLDR